MKNKYNKLTCLFGHHDYSKELTEDKEGRDRRLCRICKRSGYKEYSSGLKVWHTYDEEGNCIHLKFNDGEKCWRNVGKGLGGWRSNHENWVEKKPKNWKYTGSI